MIRVDLTPRRRRLWPWVVAALLFASGIVAGGLWQGYWVAPWVERASAPPVAARTTEPPWIDADSVPLVLAGRGATLDSGGPGAQAAAPPATAADTGVGAAAADSGRSWPLGVGGLAPGERSQGRPGSPCAATLDLCARLSPGVRLIELTCDTTGAYSLAGESTAVGSVEAFLDTLRGAGAPAAMTWWSSGSGVTDGQRPCRFVLRGQHQATTWPRPLTLSAPEAAAVLRRVALLARRLGLPGAVMLPANASASGRSLHALSTAGTPAQIRSLLDGLRQETPRAVLTVVAVAPHGDGTVPPQTQLSVAFALALARP